MFDDLRFGAAPEDPAANAERVRAAELRAAERQARADLAEERARFVLAVEREVERRLAECG